MKKFLFFVTFSLLLAFFAGAKSYKVEKAFMVSLNGKAVAPGAVINDDNIIIIEGGGYVMFVDQKGKKRYYVSRSGSSTVEDLVKMTKKPKKVAKAYLENLMTKKQASAYSSMGSVERVTTGDGENQHKRIKVPVTSEIEPVIIENAEGDKKGNIKVYIVKDEDEE